MARRSRRRSNKTRGSREACAFAHLRAGSNHDWYASHISNSITRRLIESVIAGNEHGGSGEPAAGAASRGGDRLV